MHHSDKDPIIAVATAAGRGGIGILRLSFGKALEAQIVGRLFGENCTLKARYAHLLPFLGTDGGVLDRAIVLLFPAPHSYTGESVLEIQAHGGPVLLNFEDGLRPCGERGKGGTIARSAPRMLRGRAGDEGVARLLGAVLRTGARRSGLRAPCRRSRHRCNAAAARGMRNGDDGIFVAVVHKALSETRRADQIVESVMPTDLFLVYDGWVLCIQVP